MSEKRFFDDITCCTKLKKNQIRLGSFNSPIALEGNTSFIEFHPDYSETEYQRILRTHATHFQLLAVLFVMF